jgi:hypothetical protein
MPACYKLGELGSLVRPCCLSGNTIDRVKDFLVRSLEGTAIWLRGSLVTTSCLEPLRRSHASLRRAELLQAEVPLQPRTTYAYYVKGKRLRYIDAQPIYHREQLYASLRKIASISAKQCLNDLVRRTIHYVCLILVGAAL